MMKYDHKIRFDNPPVSLEKSHWETNWSMRFITIKILYDIKKFLPLRKVSLTNPPYRQISLEKPTHLEMVDQPATQKTNS